MGLIVRSRGKVVVKFNLDRFDKRVKIYADFVKNNGLRDAASYLRDLAYAKVYDQYQRTNKHHKLDRRSLRKRSRLESALFPKLPGEGNYPPLELNGKYGFTIRLVPNLQSLNRKFKHLKWQESGTHFKLDRQPFVIYYKHTKQGRVVKLGNITKKRAATLSKDRLAILEVQHPALPARLFIKTGVTFLKTQGSKTVLSYIRERLKSSGKSSLHQFFMRRPR